MSVYGNGIIDHHSGAFPPRFFVRDIDHEGFEVATLAQDGTYQYIEQVADDGSTVTVTMTRDQAERLARLILALAHHLPKGA